MTTPFWETAPDQYDAIMLGSDTFVIFSPTRVRIDGELSVKFDVKEAPGTDGASITYRGYTPAKVDVTWALYTEDMLRDFESLLPDIRPKPGKTAPKPIEIVHPQLALYNLHKFFVEKMPLLKKAGSGIYDVTLSCVEFFPKPKSSKKGGSGKKNGGIAPFDNALTRPKPPNPTPPSKSNTGP